MLDNIINFSIRNKIVIAILTLVLIIWGTWSVTKLPIDAVPDITNNQVQIITVCPTLAGQEVEQLVTFPIEQSIANLPDLEETRSISRFGLSVITVVFKEDVDIYFARQLINERLKDAQEDIPEGIGTPELAPVSTGLGEVYQYILHPKKGSEDKYSSMDLRAMQDWIVRRQLNGTPGIAEVNSFGGKLKQYEVAVNPDRLKAMDVSISEIFTSLENGNQNTGGAYIDKKPNAYFIRGIGLVSTLEDIKNIAIKNTSSNVPILIKDVAEVRYGSAIRYGALTYNGEVDAVGGVVMMLKGENSHQVVNRIKEKLPIIQESLPDDIVIEPYLDRTDLVGRAISTVEKNLIEGALIVIFVLVLFLGNLRAGLIVASSIPLAMLFALGLMNVFGVSANLMSLGAIDFGLIVDGAVIVVEATIHHLGLRKSLNKLSQKQMDQEVYLAASKIRSSAAFGEIIILIVYIPILTLVGIEGKMFTPMAKTVGFAILGALLLSLTYIPMMCALFLSKKPLKKDNFSERMMGYLKQIYQPVLQKAIRFKYVLVGATVSLFVLTLFLFSKMGGEFIPQLQEGDFAFHCILPQGSSLNQSIETSMQASRIIKQFDEVNMVVGKTGAAEVPTDPMPPEATDMMILLKPKSQWKTNKSYAQLANEIYQALEVIPGVFFEINQPIQMRFNELMTGVRQDVAVKIFGENLDSLSLYANKVNQLIQSVQGVSVPQVEKVNGLPEIDVEYNRIQLANYGLTVNQVNDVLSTAFAGKAAGQVFENERRYDLVVRLDSAYRTDIDNVRNLMIATAHGNQIPLSQVATISYKLGAAQISRESGKRRIVIGFNVQGRDVQSVVEDIQGKLSSQIKLPTGYYFDYGGQFENLKKANDRLMIAVPVSLLLIFSLLYFTFGSIKQAVLIFTAIPMSAIGGVFGLLLRDMPFSISAGIGFIALFGVSVLNGIVLISTFNQLEKSGVVNIYKRVILGTRERLRPVLMTALVASFGFLPMALSTSAGAEVQKPLATVVIAGLVSATFLTLFVLPLLYIIFNLKFKSSMNTTKIALFVLLSLAGFQSFAQQERVIDVKQAINLALENNGIVNAKELEINAMKNFKRTAYELPKLDVSANLGQYNSTKFDQSFQVSQTFPFPSVFSTKKQLNSVQTKELELNKELAVLELKNKIRSLYYELEYLEFNQVELLKVDSLYDRFIQIAKLRYQSGDTKKVDISTAEAKRGEVSLRVSQNYTDLQNVKSQLQALLALSEPFDIQRQSMYLPLQIDNFIETDSLTKHPLVELMHQKALLADQNKKVEKAQNLPDITLGYVNQSLIGFQTINGQEKYFNSSNRFSSFNIGLSVPISFGATKSKLKSLDLQRQASESIAEQQLIDLKSEYKLAINQYQQSFKRYSYYKQIGLKNADEIVSAADLGYRTGDISYVEYLYALQTTSDIKLSYLHSIWQLNNSVINIYSLINQ